MTTIAKIDAVVVNVGYQAPIQWSGGSNASWTRTVVQVTTDDGLVGIGETQGGASVKALIDNELAALFLGEDPFAVKRMLAKTLFIPYYHGKLGCGAVAALELACWDLMGKSVARPLCELLGGRFRDEVPFSAYVFHRARNADGGGEVDTTDQVVARARELVDEYGFTTIKYKGGVRGERAEVANMWALREVFPEHKLRFDPNAIYSVPTAIRMGKEFERVGLEYYEDPVWGNPAMARVRDRVDIPLATNMCVTDLDSLAVGYGLRSVDVVLGDIFEWGGVTNITKLHAFCDATQLGVNFHSAAEGGIGQAAYLHMAAVCPALPFALDTTAAEFVDDVVVDGSIEFTGRGTALVPRGPGLGVSIDDGKLEAAHAAYLRDGDIPAYQEDSSRGGTIPFTSMY